MMITRSSPKMFPNNQTEATATRQVADHLDREVDQRDRHGAPAGTMKCFTYKTIPCSLIPWN